MAKPTFNGQFDGQIETYANGEQWQWTVLRDSDGNVLKAAWRKINEGSTTTQDDVGPDPNPDDVVDKDGDGVMDDLDGNEDNDRINDRIEEDNNQGNGGGGNNSTTFSHFDLQVTISKQPNRGVLFVNGIQDDFTSRSYNTAYLLNNPLDFEIRENDNVSPYKYRIELNTTTDYIGGMNVQQYTVTSKRIDKQTGESVQLRNYTSEYYVANLLFDLSNFVTDIEEVIDDTDNNDSNEDPFVLPYLISVDVDGVDESPILSYVFGEEEGRLRTEVYTTTETGVFNVNLDNPNDVLDYKFTYVLYKNGNEILRSNNPRQSYTLERGVSYNLSVVATKNITQSPLTPRLSINGSDILSFDLQNQKIKINFSTSNADFVRMSLGSTQRDLPIITTSAPGSDGNVGFGEVELLSKEFSSLGQYKLYLQPISNVNGSGDIKQVVINVTNTETKYGPDITHISYPQNIKGADFKGYNVDFKISWASVNTNWVDVWVGKVSDSTKLVSKRPAQGQLTLNVKDVLTKGGINVNDKQDKVEFKLLLIPFNESSDKTLTGKTEEITIKFDKGDLNLRRNSVIRDIREAIARQFDKETLNTDNSKYLTHLLHLGDGNNKVISTWDTDYETFSKYEIVNEQTGEERKVEEVKTLVLKLYEPLPNNIQPNQQVWLSKVQSIPIIEQVTVINEQIEECIPLQPNFNISITDDIGYQIIDDLIASGSTSSTDLVSQFISSSEFSFDDLDINFVSQSTQVTEFDNGVLIEETGENTWWWENFVKYSSAEERVENFYYKVKLIDAYETKYTNLTSGSSWTTSVSVVNEAKKVQKSINDLKAGFDAFEKFLFTSSSEDGLTYPKVNNTGSLYHPTSSESIGWYNSIIDSAQEYDYYNTSNLVNNLPKHIQSDVNSSEFTLFFNMIGQHFDVIWLYSKTFAESRKLEHKNNVGIKDNLVYHMLESLGWDADMGVRSQTLWEYAFGKSEDGSVQQSMSGKDRQQEIWRRILNNLPYLLKHKGTKRAVHALMSCYGVPASMLTVMEFGGPREVTQSGTTSFTYEDRTASINISGSSAITVDWKQYNGDYPNTVEVRLNTTQRQEQRIVGGDSWSLDILTDTGSLGKVQLTVGSVSSSIQPLPIFDDEYYHIAVTRESGSNFTLFVKQGFQERIRNEESATLTALDESWTSGSSIQFGGSTFEGSFDEIRLWSTPLIETVIENHTLLPDAINGNHNSASSEDLIFRNDFEYPKNRGVDIDIKNVALIQTYATSSVASGFESITEYPYNYTPYDRTVTAQVPQTGINYSNKFRFETQYETNGTTELSATSSIDLSHRQRSTKRSFDQSPIDTDRLGLFFSPTKEINMDILRSVGPINVDDFIGDPSDDYNYSYSGLDNFREYYFQRYNLNYNEYIQLVRYIDRSLFDQLESLVPARAKVAKGLLFEPHILERSKTQWNKPSGEENYHEVSIDTQEDVNVISTQDNYLALVSASEDTHLSADTPFFAGHISGGAETDVIGENISFEGTYVSTDDTNQSGEITRNDGATMGGFEFNIEAVLTASIDTFYVNSSYTEVGGFDQNDLSVAGFGLYGSGSHAIRTRLVNGHIVKDRVKAFKFDEAYTEYQRENLDYNDSSKGTNIVEVTKHKTKITIIPFEGNDLTAGGNISNVVPLNGTFSTHYRLVEDLTTGMENSFFNGSKQTAATTLDGGAPVEIFTTNPNTLKVSDTGRGSGEPILEVE